MHKHALVLAALLLAAGHGFGQPMPMRPGQGIEQRAPAYFHSIPFAASGSGEGRVDILFRIDTGFFVAVRGPHADPVRPYVRRGEILAELFDSTGSSAARKIIHVELEEASAQTPEGGPTWHTGILSLAVPPGLYRLHFEADDQESGRRFVQQSNTVRVPATSQSSLPPDAAFFVNTTKPADGDTLHPELYGGDFLFGTIRTLAILIPPDADSSRTARVDLSLSVRSGSGEDTTSYRTVRDTLVQLLRDVTLQPSQRGGEPVYQLATTPGQGQRLLLMPLPTQRFPLRTFMLSMRVRTAGREYTLRRMFRALWPDMPYSLRDVDRAIEALRFITSEDTRDSLATGSFDERRDRLEQFWAGRNRNPATAMNEVMAEYYRRVDHATREYATLRVPDGLRSDRARIYVLHGPPSSVRRYLDPQNGPKEEWIYERTGKRFTFADPTRKGDYLLEATAP